MISALILATLERAYGPPQLLCTIDDPRLTESSGLGASPSQDGVFYSHNDSGDTARFFRFDRSGLLRAEFRLPRVNATDWEDMAVVRVAGRSYIYLADVGDNGENRPAVQIYRVDEPSLTSRGGEVAYQKYVITYADRPHNCEAIFTDPQNGDIYLITKNPTAASVFHIPAPPRSGNYVAQKLGELRIATGGMGGNLVTGAAISPDGKFVTLRTYTGAREYPVQGRVRDWFRQPYVSIEIAPEQQGEAICYNRAGTALITSTEGRPAPITLIPRILP